MMKMFNLEDFSFQTLFCSFSTPIKILVTNEDESIVFGASEYLSIKYVSIRFNFNIR